MEIANLLIALKIANVGQFSWWWIWGLLAIQTVKFYFSFRKSSWDE